MVIVESGQSPLQSVKLQVQYLHKIVLSHIKCSGPQQCHTDRLFNPGDPQDFMSHWLNFMLTLSQQF
jgi:hypothetical protein